MYICALCACITAGSPETVSGKIAIYLATAVTGDPLISVDTQCVCGYASVQLPAKYHVSHLYILQISS